MLNLLLVDRLLVRVVATISLSHVCWQVFSPGAEINQNSDMTDTEAEKQQEFAFITYTILQPSAISGVFILCPYSY